MQRGELAKVARRRLRASVRFELRKFRFEDPSVFDEAGEVVYAGSRARSAGSGGGARCARGATNAYDPGRIVLRSADMGGRRQQRAPYSRILKEMIDRTSERDRNREDARRHEREGQQRHDANEHDANEHARWRLGTWRREHQLLPHYIALGLTEGGALPKTLSPASIRRAFHKRALECHPDRAASPQSAEEFRRARTAYDVLLKFYSHRDGS